MEAGFAPGVLYYLTLWFPASYRGRITSMLFLASAFSGLVGAPLSGLVLGHMDGVLGIRGWHWLFLLGGLPCIVLGLLVLKLLKDRIEDAGWLSASEKSLLASRIQRHAPHTGAGSSLLDAIRTRGFLMLGLIYFLIQVASYGLNFWAPQLIRSAGTHNPTTIGLLTAVPYICGAIAMVVVGRLSDASGERRKFVCGLLVMAAIGFFAAGIFDKQTGFLIVALGVMGAGVVASIPGVLGVAAEAPDGGGRGRRHSADQHHRATWRHCESGDGRTGSRPDRQHDARAIRNRRDEPHLRIASAVRFAGYIARERSVGGSHFPGITGPGFYSQGPFDASIRPKTAARSRENPVAIRIRC